MKVAERILIVTDILLAALYADATMTGQEADAARSMLADLLLTDADALPEHVENRIRAFSIHDFDMKRSVNAFLKDPPMQKRRLLELVAKLVHASGELDVDEDDFMRALARALEMQPQEYKDLVLDYEIEKLRDTLDNLLIPQPTSLPPPVPEDAKHKH